MPEPAEERDSTAPFAAKKNGRRLLLQCFFLAAAFCIVLMLIWRSVLGREFTMHILGRLGTVSVPLLRRAIWDDSFDVQAAAKAELNRIGSGAVPSLVRSLDAGDRKTRVQALQALAAIGQKGSEANPPVIKLLSEPDAEIRQLALNTLGAIGNNQRSVTDAVIKAMSDAEAAVRLQAVRTFGALQPSGDVALPALNMALNDTDDGMRFAVIVMFGRLNLRQPEAIAALENIAKQDKSTKVREEAGEVLALLSPQSKQAAFKESLLGEFAEYISGSSTEVAVRVGTVSVVTLRQHITAFGAVEPAPGMPDKPPGSAKITSPLPGLVAEVKCAEGQRVEKGQVLFTLDGRKLDAQIEQSRKLLAAAETNFSELEKAPKSDAASQLLLAQARQQRDNAQASLDLAKAQKDLLNINAPLGGTVTLVNVRPGEMTDPESPSCLVEIVDLGRLIVSASVPASDLSAVKSGQAVEVNVPQQSGSPQKTFSGEVLLVEDRVNPSTDLGTVDISLPASAPLRPGQFVRIKIVTDEHRDCLAVPARSLAQNEDGEWTVALVRGKLAVRQKVIPGLRDGDLVEIQSTALKAGDKIVTTGAAALSAKTVIRILKD